jgi:cell division protein FtsZ
VITKAGLVNVDFADVRTVMKDGGSAIMGTGVGRGENRAADAARMAIESPLLDSVSIAGARGVLINITGGNEMTLDEVTTIAEIVKDAVGEEAEIIFGSVSEPAMQGEVRVTVIATGFAKRPGQGGIAMPSRVSGHSTPVIPLDQARASRPIPAIGSAAPAAGSSSSTGGNAVPAPRTRPGVRPMEDLSDLEIPTFIRRQMD